VCNATYQKIADVSDCRSEIIIIVPESWSQNCIKQTYFSDLCQLIKRYLVQHLPSSTQNPWWTQLLCDWSSLADQSHGTTPFTKCCATFVAQIREMLSDFCSVTNVDRQSLATKIGCVMWKIAQHLLLSIDKSRMCVIRITVSTMWNLPYHL